MLGITTSLAIVKWVYTACFPNHHKSPTLMSAEKIDIHLWIHNDTNVHWTGCAGIGIQRSFEPRDTPTAMRHMFMEAGFKTQSLTSFLRWLKFIGS